MPKVVFDVYTSLQTEQVLALLTDFSDRRPELWPVLDREMYAVYRIGETFADVKEGSLRPLPMWERDLYDWSTPGRVRWTVQKSNYCPPGSYVEVTFSSAKGGGSLVHVEWSRTGTGLGGKVLIALVVLTRGSILRKKSFESAFEQAVQTTGSSRA